MGASYAAMNVFSHAANPAVTGLADLPAYEIVLFFFRTILGLLGEEILTVLPFLAVMTFAYSRLDMPRGAAIAIAWIASAVLFGAAHLPTYDWNFAQAFGIIGLARLILTLPYMQTKNIWVSTGAHIVNDWMLF